MPALANDTILVPVLSKDCLKYWDSCKTLIDKALEYCDGRVGVEDVKNSILQCDMQLWLIVDSGYPDLIKGICVTEIINYPKSKRCIIVFMSGTDIDNVIIHCHIIYKWAKENGCDAVEIFGRPGWQRIFKKANMEFEKVHDVIRMFL